MLKDFVKLDNNLCTLLTNWNTHASCKFEVNQDNCSWDELNFLIKCGYVIRVTDDTLHCSKPENWRCKIRLSYSGRIYKLLYKQWRRENYYRGIITAVTLLTSVASIVLSLISLLG